MRLVSFKRGDVFGLGQLTGDQIEVFETSATAPVDPRPILTAITTGAPLPASVGQITLAEATLLPPVPDAAKIFCVATNFHEPAREGKPDPTFPLMFTRTADSLVGHEEDLLKPQMSEKYDFEGELALIIGKKGHKIESSDAMTHIAGYACFNDGSVRDWQKHSTQFTPGKNFYRSGSFGPWMVSRDDIPDPSTLHLQTRVNGVVKQEIAMNQMIFDCAWLITYISTFTPLNPGDVIVTGTPSGFGSTRKPPEFLQAGDVVEVVISEIGTLTNRVAQDTDTRDTPFRKDL